MHRPVDERMAGANRFSEAAELMHERISIQACVRFSENMENGTNLMVVFELSVMFIFRKPSPAVKLI